MSVPMKCHIGGSFRTGGMSAHSAAALCPRRVGREAGRLIFAAGPEARYETVLAAMVGAAHDVFVTFTDLLWGLPWRVR